MTDFIDTLFDAAEAELEDAQKDYEKILSEKAGEEILEARARLAVMQERYETARDELQELQTGEFSLEVQVARAAKDQAQALADQARAGLAQAEANIVRAEKAVDQAQAALDAIEVQLEKLMVRAPVGGVVLTRNLEPGEIIHAGVAALTLGRMDKMTIAVYIPEDRYGQVKLGDLAKVTVDSFEGKTFEARVVRIADQAEYTPRNVQTEEDRRTTVYAIELSVDDPEGLLKPGMPADVVFGG
jgi:multidrug resistance efflux pump